MCKATDPVPAWVPPKELSNPDVFLKIALRARWHAQAQNAGVPVAIEEIIAATGPAPCRGRLALSSSACGYVASYDDVIVYMEGCGGEMIPGPWMKELAAWHEEIKAAAGK